MRMRHSFLHPPGERIEGAQAHSMRKALEGLIWFAEPHFGPAACGPPQRQIWINQQCLVLEGSAIVELASDIGERMSRVTEYGRIVLTQLHRQSSQPPSFRNLLFSIDNQPGGLAHAKTSTCCGIRRREISLKLDSFVVQTDRLLIRLSCPFVCICQPAQKEVVGVEAFGWLAPGTFDFCLFESRRDCADHLCSHLVLQRKDILDCPLEAIGPKVCAR